MELFETLSRGLAGRYAIEREIGRGGMATVYRARDLRHNRWVALKVLKPDLAASIGSARFLREIEIAAGLAHPHILPLYDSGEVAVGHPGEPPKDPPLLFYVMPYVEGESLRQRLAREGALPVDQALRIAREVADALNYAHAHGLVHRDIKPENILLQADHALVTDFGIAYAVDAAGAERLTGTGMALGTPWYMSPEQWAAGRIDSRSDLYSLGCVLYEMLAGEAPFLGASIRTIMVRHASEPIPSLRTLRAEVPIRVERAIHRALAKTPADRFASAADFAAALTTGAGEEGAWRRPVTWMWRLGLAVVVAAVGVGGGLRWRAARSSAPLSSTAVAILPFSVAGNDSLGLGLGMVNLLSTKLDGAGALRSVDPRALLSYVGPKGPGDLSPDQAQTIAQHFGAGLYVLGDILEIGGRLTVNASLYDATRQPTIVGKASIQGHLVQVLELVDSIAARLLLDWGGGSTRVTAIAAVTTHSLVALKAYLEGESAVRAGDFERAVDAFQRAGAADTMFALAWYRLSVAAEWLTREELTRFAAERAAALSERLPDRDRALLQALLANRRGDVPEAERLFRSIIGTHPDDVEAWIQLGELLFHNGPPVGRSATESKQAWERVLFFEPDNLASLIHLSRLAAGDGATATLDTLVQRIQDIREKAGENEGRGRAEELEMGALRAYARGDSVERRRWLERLRHASDLTVYLTAWDLACFAHDLPGAEEIARLLTDPARTAEVREVGWSVLAHLELARGRWNAAQAVLASAESDAQPLALESLSLLAMAPFLPDPPDLATIRGRLAGMRPQPDPTPAPEASTQFAVHHGLHAGLKEYLSGLLSAIAGDSALALRQAAGLNRLAPPNRADHLFQNQALAIRAQVALRSRPADALALLEQMRMTTSYLVRVASPFHSLPRERFLHAELLARVHRPREAVRWYGAFDQFSIYDIAYLAPALLRQAALFQQLGARDQAVASFRRAAELWRDADPGFRQLLHQVEGSLSDSSVGHARGSPVGGTVAGLAGGRRGGEDRRTTRLHRPPPHGARVAEHP